MFSYNNAHVLIIDIFIQIFQNVGKQGFVDIKFYFVDCTQTANSK